MIVVDPEKARGEALCRFPAQIIATHTADMLAARIDESYEIGGEA